MASKVHRRNRRPRICVCPVDAAIPDLFIRGTVFDPGNAFMLWLMHSVVSLGSLALFNSYDWQDFNGPIDLIDVSLTGPGQVNFLFDAPLSDFVAVNWPADSLAIVGDDGAVLPLSAMYFGNSI